MSRHQKEAPTTRRAVIASASVDPSKHPIPLATAGDVKARFTLFPECEPHFCSEYEYPEAVSGMLYHFLKGVGSILDVGGTSGARVTTKRYNQLRQEAYARLVADYMKTAAKAR